MSALAGLTGSTASVAAAPSSIVAALVRERMSFPLGSSADLVVVPYTKQNRLREKTVATGFGGARNPD
ncbi:hypothetical protein GCM10027280_40510 [Micromonospora polyrhachis]